MIKAPLQAPDTGNYCGLTAEQLLAVIAAKDAELQLFAEENKVAIAERDKRLRLQQITITLLEEKLRLATLRKFAASSEKLPFQVALFDEVEMEAALSDLEEQLPEENADAQAPAKAARQRRKRGFSDALPRKRIELCLSDDEKAGATSTFFSKVKEELEYIPAQLNVLEYWQEKAVFEQDGVERLVAAARPVHPLNKCFAHLSLLTYILIAKYADGLPLYRLEGILKRYGNPVSRSTMAQWMIRLGEVFNPLLQLLRDSQNSAAYLHADETRIQVLKEDGCRAQTDKWMWVTCGGPSDKPSVLFAYDPTRAGAVPVRLLDDFSGILQADGYSGYAVICRKNSLTRIGCWDHARRKFVEATRIADSKAAKNGKVSKADMALSYIRKLYRIESALKDCSEAERYRKRQELSIPVLNDFKAWLDKNQSKVMKGSQTRKAIDYTLNQWDALVGYCERGDLNISNARAENAIRPFAVGRKAWLFADTAHGAHASAACYSLIETAKANQLEPYAYIRYVLEHIGTADTKDKINALLPWNVPLETNLKNARVYE